MAGFTNRGKFLLLKSYFHAQALPTNLYVALVTDAVAPDADIDTLGQLTEIAAGNGYTSGGIQLTANATDFDVLAEVDASDYGHAVLKDIVFTASGGDLPASGGGARYMALTTDEVTEGDRQVIAWFDLGSARTVSDTQSLTIQDAEMRLTE